MGPADPGHPSRSCWELAGLRLRPAQPARCALEIPPEAPPRPALARLAHVGGGLPLSWPSPSLPGAPAWNGCWWPGTADGWTCRVWRADGTPFQPFAFGGTADTSLLLGFGQKPEETLRLWFQVHQPDGVQRNPPRPAGPAAPHPVLGDGGGRPGGAPAGRDLGPQLERLCDACRRPKPGRQGRTACGGCACARPRAAAKKQVRLSGLSAGRYQALQQETRAASYFFTVNGQAGCRVQIASAQARKADLAVFSAGRHGLAADRAL